MKGYAFRTLVVLACGAVMALVAYVSQVANEREEAALGAGLSMVIHTSTVDGYRFEYRLAYPAEGVKLAGGGLPEAVANRKALPELMLFLSDPQGDPVSNAAVKYSVTGPDRGTLQARALSVQGGYGAGIYCDVRGTYLVEVEAVTHKDTLNDKFGFEVQ